MQEVGGGKFPEDTLQELGKWQASSIIDQLQSFKKQLAGDKPLDMSQLTDLDEEGPTSTVDKHTGLVVFAAVVLIAIALKMFS